MANQQVIKLVRAQLKSFHELSKEISGAVPHNNLKGRFREIFVQNIIAPYLPPNIELLSGTILFPNGASREFRNEDDVIVYDHNRSPLLLRSIGREAIMPSTGVRMHIEVKSRLDINDIRKAVNASVEINNNTIGDLPIGMIFAFDTNINSKKRIVDVLLDELKNINYSPKIGQTNSPIQSICIVNRGCWMLTGIPQKSEGWYFAPPEDDKGLLLFISAISNTLFGNGLGIGNFTLDINSLLGPEPKMNCVNNP